MIVVVQEGLIREGVTRKRFATVHLTPDFVQHLLSCDLVFRGDTKFVSSYVVFI